RARRRSHLPGLPGLVAGSHLSHEPDPGGDAEGEGGGGLDDWAAVRAGHRRGRLLRPSALASSGAIRGLCGAPKLGQGLSGLWWLAAARASPRRVRLATAGLRAGGAGDAAAGSIRARGFGLQGLLEYFLDAIHPDELDVL